MDGCRPWKPNLCQNRGLKVFASGLPCGILRLINVVLAYSARTFLFCIFEVVEVWFGLVVGGLSIANPVWITLCGNFRRKSWVRELPFGMCIWEPLDGDPNLAKLGGGWGSRAREAGGTSGRELPKTLNQYMHDSAVGGYERRRHVYVVLKIECESSWVNLIRN